jgi:chaperonin GroES
MSGLNATVNVGRVLLNIDDAPADRSAGGIYIPEAAREQGAIKRARVVQAGPPRKQTDGSPVSIDFENGSTVLVDALGGTKVKVDGTEYVIVRHEDILMKL